MHHSNMAWDGSSEKDISVAFEKLSIRPNIKSNKRQE